MNQQSFDDIVKEKMEQFSAPVPADAWDNIMRKKKRRVGFFWWVGVLLLAGGVFYGVVSDNAHESLMSKSNDDVSVRQSVISKDNVADSNGNVKVYQSAINKNNVANDNDDVSVRQSVISKDNVADSNVNVKVYQSAINKNNVANDNGDESIRQSVSKDNVADNNGNVKVYQSAVNKNNVADNNGDESIRQSVISKDNIANNNGDESVHKSLIIKNKEDDNYTTGNAVYDIHLIKGYYLQTLIDYSIAHILIDTNQIRIKIEKPIWTIDVSITPFIPIQKNEAVLYLQRIQTTNANKIIYTADKIETSEETSLAYSFAIRRKINKRLELGAGLQYARIRENVWLSGKEINTASSVIQRLHNDNSGPYLADVTYQTNTTGTRIINASNSYSTVSIPLFIQYEVVKQRSFSLYLNSGAYLNVIRKYSNSIKGDFDVTYVSGMQQGSHKMQMGVDLFAGLRLATASGKKYRFFAEPNFRYSFMKNNTSNMINAKYLHQAGLSIGVSYSIH